VWISLSFFALEIPPASASGQAPRPAGENAGLRDHAFGMRVRGTHYRRTAAVIEEGFVLLELAWITGVW
jgi:hypothetical protein